MADPAFAPVLKDLGLAGYVISGLATAVTGLAGYIVLQWRGQSKAAAATAKERLSERESLLSALNSTGKAIEAIVRATEANKLVTAELGEVIQTWITTMEVINERLAGQHVSNTEKLKDIKDVVGSFAESQRTLAAMVTEVRNGGLNVTQVLADFRVTLESIKARRSR